MAGLRQVDRRIFPLQDISSVVRIFRKELEGKSEPDLALLSIIAGAVENSMTCNRTFTTSDENDVFGEPKIPTVEYNIVDALYSKFHAVIKGAVDLTLYGEIKYATRELVKRVSDVIWNSLTRSYYKDRAHLQSLYSYLTGNKLDCFGVALAVVAGCQVLGFSDVHLALSEDHAWVIFGEHGEHTAEVTWHGKGNEDKRGQEINPGVNSRSWLYVNGYPVICSRHMEVAALVSAINPSLNMTNDAIEVALLQQELLWLLYDLGHLSRYPMAIGNLADLEEISPSPGRPPCSTLFQEAILCARKHYNNQHVYPYTYQAGYFYRHNMYKEAFESWANASDVIRQYNYSRDDEEIYKELMEIANELIPHIMKVVSSGHSARSILKDPECFAHLLRFYDGICQWEEGSQTPVLHIGWAKPLVNTISKFDAEVRTQVVILGRGLIESEDNKDDMKEVGGDLLNNNNDCCKTREGDLISSLESKVKDCKQVGLHPSIEALTAACSERILNRDFLLQGGGEPFVGGSEFAGTSSGAEVLKIETALQPKLILHSQKMRGLKDLLLAEKLNTHAISLQLTAQSQVQVGKKTREDQGLGTRPKRTRRE
ncbi:menin 1 [Lycorma delicatula]|uniref:menin 1 n=1 Tax=Lycorma delicatula TaxID=130591 RepID=UPI003F50FDFB